MAFLGDLSNSLFGAQDSGSYAQQQAQIQQQANEDRARAIQAQNQQGQLAQYLHMAMLGQGPSVAQDQLMMGLEAQRRAQMSQAAGISGPGAALGNYMSAYNSGQAGADTNAQASVLRAQEIAQARQQLGGLYANQAQTGAQLYGTGQGAALGFSGQNLSQQQANQAQRQTQEGAILTGGGSLLSGIYSGRSSGGSGSSS